MPKDTSSRPPAPDFTLPGGRLVNGHFERQTYSLSAHRGRPLVLAFYPGDDTPVCTRQMCSYTNHLEQFTTLDAEVWGISPQDVDSHENFARSKKITLPLLADTDRAVARSFGVTAPLIGVRRSVCVIDAAGRLSWQHTALLGATFQPVAALVTQLSLLKTRSR
ncbi:peroxiredoxin [Streptomyces sp. MNP-20]|uniref:peroxiredoxin n=1 Tax=Streptomyces sp. MNP-20 TaxID=2721165 RepID=UPI001551A294|nr:peroxiredoxin [Streptomyces sp. MNP-20]